jgi:hypothetical protein
VDDDNEDGEDEDDEDAGGDDEEENKPKVCLFFLSFLFIDLFIYSQHFYYSS